VQLRFTCLLSAEQYVLQRFWENASLPPCPIHPEGGCGFCWHTPYQRKNPPGAWIARGYCRLGHITVSLLPDCLASRLPSTLQEVEEQVRCVEEAGGIRRAAEQLHPNADQVDQVQGAERRLRRRYKGIRSALVIIAGLIPELLGGRPPTLVGWRLALGCESVLVELRAKAASHLTFLPPPFGLGPRLSVRKKRTSDLQQYAGPAPPEFLR
jgi:hypothetical protein